MRKFKFNPGKEIRLDPFYCFFCFFLSNVLLSYFDLSLFGKLQVVLIGLAAPFFIFLFNKIPSAKVENGSWLINNLPIVPGWLWVVVFFLGCFLRFYRFFSLAGWPYFDEGVCAFGAMELYQNNSWHFFYSATQHPPLVIWALGLFFKVFPPSLLSLGLFTGFLSVIALGLTYWEGRSYFSKSFAFICFFLVATGFWPLYIGRFCTYETFSLSWEFFVFLLLILFRENSEKNGAWKYALVLGISTGVGFFSYVVWTVVAILVALAVLDSSKKEKSKVLIAFFIPLITLTLVFFFFYYRYTHLDAIRNRLAFLPNSPGKRQWMIIIDVISSFFWGCPEYHYIDYGPVWGGLLNPVLSSFFFMGLIQCYKKRKSPFIQWLLLGLIIFVFPGLIAKGLDTFRVIYVLPILLLITAIGISWFQSSLKNYRGIILSILLVSSLFLDFFHFFVVYHTIWGMPGPQWSYLKSVPLYAAYQVLEGKAQTNGPGNVLSDLRPITYDQTLTLAAFPFDAAHNRKINPQDAKWSAVLVTKDYIPFLSKRFPGMGWFRLGKEHSWDAFDWWLGIIPVTESNRATMQHWVKANEAFQAVANQLMNLANLGGQRPIFERFLKCRELMEGDQFLESCFWEKMLYFYWAVNRDREKALKASQQYLKYGYPSPRIQKLERIFEKIPAEAKPLFGRHRVKMTHLIQKGFSDRYSAKGLKFN